MFEVIIIHHKTYIYEGNVKNVKMRFFFGFDLEDIGCANFHDHICNQRVKIPRYTKIQSDRRCLVFGSLSAKIKKHDDIGKNFGKHILHFLEQISLCQNYSFNL